MLKLKSIKFKNIGRFVEEQIIDFADLSGLVQIDAKNKNTGGSSGSGKSTIFLALEYNLGINDVPVTILQSRLTRDGICVETFWDYNSIELYIKRTKKGLTVKLGEETIEGSSKLTEEKLDQILGMPRDLFRVIVHKRQREGGFFLNFTPKQTHEFLVDAKGLNAHTLKAEEIDKDLKKLEEDQKQADNGLQVAVSGLQSTLDALLTIGEPPAPSQYTEVQISDLRVYLDSAQKLIAENEAIQVRERNALAKDKPITTFEIFDRSKIIAAEKEILNLNVFVGDLERKEKSRQSAIKDQVNVLRIKAITAKSAVEKAVKAKTEAQRIVLELKKIKEGSCPTCEQSWVTESAQSKNAKLLQEFEEQKALIIAGIQAETDLAALNKEIETLTPEMTPIYPLPEMKDISLQLETFKLNLAVEKGKELEYNKNQNANIKAASDAYLMRLNALQVRHTAELSALKDEVAKASQALSSANLDFESAKMSASRYNTTFESLKAQAEKRKTDKHIAENGIIELKEKLEIVTEAKALVKSFISCSFDEALESISDKATSIVRGIPNMATATIQLEGVRETKEGKVREEVTAVLHVDGEQGVPIKSLSGGERSALDLAIDLAVIDFLEDETGKGTDIFILDEPFTGLGPIEIEPVLELLKNSNLNKRIILVDHNEIVKEHVQNRIIVTRDGDTSSVDV